MKVVIAGGGTGGHLYPGIAVAEKLIKTGVEPLFLVSDRGIEKRVLTSLGYNFIEQDVSGFSGVSYWNKVKSIKKLFSAYKEAAKYIKDGDKILLLGGFASAPASLNGFNKGYDVYLHEQNSVMGLVNKLSSYTAKQIFLSFDHTKNAPARSYAVGNPVRYDIMSGSVKNKNDKNILVLGGSGGSRIINQSIAQIAERLLSAGYNIRHQTGEKLYNETIEEYEKYISTNNSRLEILPYIDDISSSYNWSDIVIARSGSGTVFEVMYSRRPALYIPFSHASDNHQYYNAIYAVNKGYAAVLTEDILNADRLFNEISVVFENIEVYKQKLDRVKVVDSAALILKGMELT